MNAHLATALYIVLTLIAYACVRRLYVKYNHPLLNVVALSAAVVIVVLVLADISYEAYIPAKDIMTAPIGAATVALALPLGSFLAMFSVGLIAQLGGLPRDVVMSILPKGVSIPFAVEIAGMHGGIPALTAAFVVATGTLGSLLGAWTLTLARVRDPMARGLSLGTVSHAQGTASALLEGEQQGAMAGLAMILAGILSAAMSPLVVWLLGIF
jgi:putative effector of murein hydrolase